jgi:hypothetical protein
MTGGGNSTWDRFLRLRLWDRLDKLDERLGLRWPQDSSPRSRRAAWTLAAVVGSLLLSNAVLDWYAFSEFKRSGWMLAAAVLATAAVPVVVVHFARSAGRMPGTPRKWVWAAWLLYLTLRWLA